MRDLRLIEWLEAQPARKLYMLVGLFAAAVLLPFLGNVHLFDWDEINFAEAAREMLVLGDWQRVHINYQPFWEKPPLFIWAQALSMKVFGVNEYAARLPNALCGIATAMLLVHVGARFGGRKLGLLWSLVYLGSFLPHFYFRSGIIDPLFNLFIFIGVWQLAEYYRPTAADEFVYIPKGIERLRHILWGGLAVGLALLTKGPVGLLLPALTWFAVWVLCWGRMPFPYWQGPLYAFIALATSLLWFGYDLVTNGPWFMQEFVTYQIRLLTTGDAGHEQPFWYHWVVVLVGCFPVSAFVFGALRRRFLFPGDKFAPEQPGRESFLRWMALLMLVVLVVFTLVKTKIVHYSSLAYFPVAYLGAWYLHRLMFEGEKWPRWLTRTLVAVGSVLLLAILLLPWVGMNSKWIASLLKNDPFTAGNLQADVQWSGLEYGVGLTHLAVILLTLWFVRRGLIQRAGITLFAGTAFTLNLLLPVLVPRIEGYSQRAAVEFFEGLQGCDCYVTTLEYKSYAHLFYAQIRPQYSPASAGIKEGTEYNKWLLYGQIDAPAYFSVKIQDLPNYRDIPELELLSVKNGFAFLRRMPPPGHNLTLRQMPAGQALTSALPVPRPR